MIVIKNLVKNYDNLCAVNSINLNIEEGCFYGLLGPNGAGKTTTIKMMATLLTPCSGSIHINGKKMHRRAKDIKAQIGMVPQHFSLQRDMSVKETLFLHGYLHQMKKKNIKSRFIELISFAKMTGQEERKVQHLSGGNRRKLMIIRSLMHNPKILFLDEPTVGLDPAIRRTIWDFLKSLKEEGLTIILTTHYIEEANILCDRISMMGGGKLIKEATPKEFLKEIKPVVLEHFNGITTENHLFNSKKEAAEFSLSLDGDVVIRQSNLEDVYVHYTNGEGLGA